MRYTDPLLPLPLLLLSRRISIFTYSVQLLTDNGQIDGQPENMTLSASYNKR